MTLGGKFQEVFGFGGARRLVPDMEGMKGAHAPYR
jgi:hypothetical protein